MRFWGTFSAAGAVALGLFIFLQLTRQPYELKVGQEPPKRFTEEVRTRERAAETSAGLEEPEATPVVDPVALAVPEARQAAAPCEGCLDEQATVDVASEYLDNVGVDYIDVWVEIFEDFPWRGDTELVWTYQLGPHALPQRWFQPQAAPPPLGPAPIEYVGELMNGIRVPPADGQPDLTWRVWYQTGWVRVETIERHVDHGLLPLEALAWPPQRYAKSFLVHAQTGAIAATPIEGWVDTPTVWVERDRNAKEAATKLAKRWLTNLRRKRK